MATLVARVQRGKAQTPPTETLTVAAAADTYVESTAPTTNFNSDARLRADGDPIRIAYLRFTVAGVNGRPVQQARLRLGVAGASDNGGTIHRITDNGWNEAAVTYSNRPAVNGSPIQSLGAVSIGSIVEFDLTGVVTDDGVYSFAIDTPSLNAVSYNSAAAASGQKPVLVLTVPAGPEPAVTIVQPGDGATFFIGDTVTLRATARDTVDGDLGAAVVWESDAQGALGTGGTLATSLALGPHTLTARVTDRDGFIGTAHVGVTVNPRPPANTEPLVVITAPVLGRTLTAGEPIAFAGTATDLEDGVLTPRLTWSSDRDGALGMGGSLTHALSAGTHRLQAVVSDSGRLTGQAVVTVTVVPPPTAEFLPVADAYVDQAKSSTNFGTVPLLRASSAGQVAYLRFAVTGVGTQELRRVVLRLQVDGTTAAASDRGGAVQRITATTWQETAVTYATRPALDGTVLASAGAVSAGQIVDFDVTAGFRGDGMYAFALTSTSANNVDYRARESATPPRLIVTLAANAPRVAITAPANQAVLTTGPPVTFTASATDVEDGDVGARIAWSSNLAGLLGTGPTLTTGVLHAGTHTITASAIDADGHTGKAEITIRVREPNIPPHLVITAPTPGTSPAAGTPVTFAATASDDFDAAVQVRWSSSLGGPLGTGSPLTFPLGEGTHTITAAATDSDGATSTATVSLVVTPTPPSVTIASPAAGTTVFAGTPVSFSGTARDMRGTDLSAALGWTSSVDGPIGAGASFSTASLRPGRHTITAAATSAAGLTGKAERTLVVRPPNASPQVAIQAPADGGMLLGGKPVLLAATAGDAEDGNLAAVVRWTSSRDGVLAGTGAIRTVPTLSIGMHVLTASVTDRDGTTASASVTVTVAAASLAFPVVADTYVDAGKPTTAFGSALILQACGSPVRQAFLRFAVSGLGGFAVDRAVLRLTVGKKSADASKVGGTVVALRGNTWSESTTYASRPPIDGPVLSTRAAVKVKQAIDFDVTAALAGDGSYDFALTSTSTDFVNYQSREVATGKPQLLVTLKQNTAPVIAISAPAAGTRVRTSTPVTLAATATDAESGNLDAQVRWSSSLDGPLGTGATLTLATLRAGAHTLSARVTDPSGASAEAQVRLLVNHPPAVTITAPASGTVLFATRLPLALAATASDPEDGDLGARTRWTSSLDGPLGTGPALAAGTLRAGTHTLTAAVTDDAGASTEAQVSVRVRGPNVAPTVTITAPIPSASTPVGTPVTLAATATDDFDQSLAGRIQWTSSQDGVLGTGTPLTLTLREGRHTLFAAVTDSDGATGTAQVPFTVSPTPPVVAITAPATGALLFAERPLTFTGTATDATDGPLSAGLIWSSDRDGLIGAGASFTTARLSVGSHTITAAVTDAGGLRSQALRTVVIRPRNTAPVVTLAAPADGAALLAARRLHFAATAIDAEDGNLGAGISWTSDRDGALGRGPALVLSTLSVGTHVLSASVTDQAGETTTSAETVTVSPSTVAFPAVADTTVDASAPTAVLGGATQLTADGSPVKQVFLRFAVSGLEPFAVGRARLRLTTGSTTTASSNAGGTLYTLTDGTWSEAATTYANRPVVDGAPVAAAGPVGKAAAVDFDVTALLRGSGIYDFALLTTSTDDAVYQSREAASGGPQLILELRQPTDAQVTITAPASGGVVPFDLAVVMQATAADQEDGELGTALRWLSNIDGPLGVGPMVTRWLSPGVHTLTANVTDTDGNPGSAAVRLEVQARDVGVRDFAFGSGVEDGASNEATARPAESKLWYVDGIWWATLYDKGAGAHMIHRLDRARNVWVNIGVVVDERAISRQDVLWDGDKLYMASRCAGLTPQNRLYRFSYVPGTQTWVRDPGFPVEIPGGGTGALTIAKDSTGALWIAYALDLQLYVARSLDSETEWSPGIPLPVGDGTQTIVHVDDLIAIIALPGQIGVFWSNQNTKTDYFAVHDDGTSPDDPATWRLEIAGQGGKFADGHLNLKVASDGRLFAMVKTSYGTPGDILDGLLVRSASGSWSPLFAISLVEDNPTRELILLDEVQRKIFAFYSFNHEAIYYKVSDMDTIAFPDGPGIPFIANAAVADLNNPQGTKQNVTPTSGLVVIASSRLDNSYWHNVIDSVP